MSRCTSPTRCWPTWWRRRRPTVTKALGELAERSTVIWTGDDWLLPGDPPDELDSVASVRVPAAIQ